jgi:Ca2+-binding EF-hand superfamily protein
MFRKTLSFMLFLASPIVAQETSIARTDGQFMRDILSLDRGVETFEELLPKYLDLFRQNDFDGEPGYSLKDREMYVDAWEAKLLSERMQDFLKDDLNGDLKVTLEELRVFLTRDAYNHLRIRRADRTPIPDAVQKYISEKTTAYLRNFDLDGDEEVSFEEARVKARDISKHAASTTVPIPRMAPSLAHDLDGDTTISEQEMIALARQVFDAYDANGSGKIEPVERELASKLRKSPPAFMFGQSRTSSREIEGPTCPFPRGDEDLPYYLIGGFEGAAMTNLHFENPNEAVEAVRIEVPEEGPPIRLIAAFQSGTILWLEDPGGVRYAWPGCPFRFKKTAPCEN